MATKRKAPSAYCERNNGFWHREATRRWAIRKKNAQRMKEEDRIDLAQDLGGTRQVFIASVHLARVKVEAARREKQLLATTSLRDLIK